MDEQQPHNEVQEEQNVQMEPTPLSPTPILSHKKTLVVVGTIVVIAFGIGGYFWLTQKPTTPSTKPAASPSVVQQQNEDALETLTNLDNGWILYQTKEWQLSVPSDFTIQDYYTGGKTFAREESKTIENENHKYKLGIIVNSYENPNDLLIDEWVVPNIYGWSQSFAEYVKGYESWGHTLETMEIAGLSAVRHYWIEEGGSGVSYYINNADNSKIYVIDVNGRISKSNDYGSFYVGESIPHYNNLITEIINTFDFSK